MKHLITKADVKTARASAGLTQAAAARLIYTSINNWQNWEQGRFPMIPALYELFLLKTGRLTLGDSLVDTKTSRPRSPRCAEPTSNQEQGSYRHRQVNSMEFACRVIALRKAKGLTQAGLAGLIGSTKQSVSNWEAGRYGSPRGPTLLRLSEALERTGDYILYGHEANAGNAAIEKGKKNNQVSNRHSNRINSNRGRSGAFN